jgi:hypothetical protein
MATTTTRPRVYRRAGIETKPFYLTSEFLVTVLMTVSLFIASMVVDDLDSRLAWILGVSLVGAYVLSRGIAKAGTRSMSYDPREVMFDHDADAPTTGERRAGTRV